MPFKTWLWNWALVKSKRISCRSTSTTDMEEKNKRNNITTPYVEGVSQKLMRFFNKHSIPGRFKPSNTLRQKLVYPKDKTQTQTGQCSTLRSMHWRIYKLIHRCITALQIRDTNTEKWETRATHLKTAMVVFCTENKALEKLFMSRLNGPLPADEVT